MEPDFSKYELEGDNSIYADASGQPMLIVASTPPAATAPRPSTAWP